ncbi:MAG: UPF0149 family protein [Proteobacteria bacterium]|nr:UPF0149 family protein [Pseudomonadota bacterium]
MKNTPADWPDYDIFGNYLFTAGTPLSPAYLHGQMVATLCVAPQEGQQTFNHLLAHIPLLSKISNESKLIESLFRQTQHQLRSFEGIKLMLPDDETPLTWRLEALVNWCEGFLEGFSEALTEKPSVKEILTDFEQIKLLSFDAIENEENEKNYMEIVEFVRIGVLFIYDEYRRVLVVEQQLH